MKERIGETCKCVASEQMSEMSLPLGKYLKLHRKHRQITEKNALSGTPVLKKNDIYQNQQDKGVYPKKKVFCVFRYQKPGFLMLYRVPHRSNGLQSSPSGASLLSADLPSENPVKDSKQGFVGNENL